jgi:site-specific DNA-methyltransferase (adenine-specific)
MLDVNTVYQGDCLELMQSLDDTSIDLVVTSPPYDNLRTYNGGIIWSDAVWKAAFQELFRVTKQGGVVVWVVLYLILSWAAVQRARWQNN